MTDFFSAFKADIALLSERTQSLSTDRRLLSNMNRLHEIMNRFPDDPGVFLWITSNYYGLIDVKNALRALKHRFSTLRSRPFSAVQVQWKLGLHWKCHALSLSEYMRILDLASQQAYSLFKKFDRFIREIGQTQRDRDLAITPETLMGLLRPILRHVVLAPWKKTQRLAFYDKPLAGLPTVRVPFYLITTLTLIVDMLHFRLSGLEDVSVAIAVDNTFLSLYVVSPRVEMRPALWEFIHQRLTRSPTGNIDDYFRAVGGFIDPQTWDMGLGQGVVIRLPWAESLS